MAASTSRVEIRRAYGAGAVSISGSSGQQKSLRSAAQSVENFHFLFGLNGGARQLRECMLNGSQRRGRRPKKPASPDGSSSGSDCESASPLYWGTVFEPAFVKMLESYENEECFYLLNEVNERGRTLLHELAAAGWHHEFLLALELGASIKAVDTKLKQTPLHVAVSFGHEAVVWAIVEHVRACERGNKKSSKLLREIILNARDSNGRTPLHLACIESMNAEIVGILLDCGAEHNVRDDRREVPLLQALQLCDVDSPVLTAFTLRKAFTTLTTPENETCLHLALLNGHHEVSKDILACHIVDINASSLWGTAAVHIAAANDDVELLELLVDFGANLLKQDYSGQTPLHVAIAAESENAVRYFLRDEGYARIWEIPDVDGKIPKDLLEDEDGEGMLSPEEYAPFLDRIGSGKLRQQGPKAVPKEMYCDLQNTVHNLYDMLYFYERKYRDAVSQLEMERECVRECRLQHDDVSGTMTASTVDGRPLVPPVWKSEAGSGDGATQRRGEVGDRPACQVVAEALGQACEFVWSPGLSTWSPARGFGNYGGAASSSNSKKRSASVSGSSKVEPTRSSKRRRKKVVFSDEELS